MCGLRLPFPGSFLGAGPEGPGGRDEKGDGARGPDRNDECELTSSPKWCSPSPLPPLSPREPLLPVRDLGDVISSARQGKGEKEASPRRSPSPASLQPGAKRSLCRLCQVRGLRFEGSASCH